MNPTPNERADEIIRRCWSDSRLLEQSGESHFKGLDVEIADAIRAAISDELQHVEAILDWTDAALRTCPNLDMMSHERVAYTLLRHRLQSLKDAQIARQ